MDEPIDADALPDDPEALTAMLAEVDPAEAPELVERIAAALERALAER